MNFFVQPELVSVFDVVHEQALVNDSDADALAGDALLVKLADPEPRISPQVHYPLRIEALRQVLGPDRAIVEIGVHQVGQPASQVQIGQIRAGHVHLEPRRGFGVVGG